MPRSDLAAQQKVVASSAKISPSSSANLPGGFVVIVVDFSF